MRVITSADLDSDASEPSVVSIGFFDGVHLGHRQLLGAASLQASEMGLSSAVVTFDVHPARVLRPDHAPLLLTTLEQKLELLSSSGLDTAYVVHFDEERALETAEHFVRNVLSRSLDARAVIVGEDFHFGHNRGGNVALLEEMGSELGFEVQGHALVGADGRVARPEFQVSSTAIRRALAAGHLDEANRMLGRSHEMTGTVVMGDQRGRLIGFPTANVAVGIDMLMPGDGIYAGHVSDGDSTMGAAIYVGKRPTFYDDQPASLIEAHCLDFEGDLYGRTLTVSFEHRLRGEQRFGGIEALSAQLAVDCQRAREWLSSAPSGAD